MKRGAVLIFLVLLAVIPAGGFPITGHVVEVSPKDLTIMQLAGSPSTGMGSVKIFVVDDATFAALSGSSVTVFDQSGASMGMQAVGAAGASFLLPPGRYAAEARATGYQAERADFSISVAAPRSLTIPLRRAAAGQGTAKVKAFDASRVCTAILPDCNLIYSAKVTLYDAQRNFIAAKDTGGGAAIFSGLQDGRYVAEASAPGFNPNSLELTVPDKNMVAIPLTPRSSGPELPVYLNVKFQMSQGQTAVVRDYQDMRITLAGITPACPPGQACLAAAPSAYFRVTASGSGGGGSTPAIRFIHPKSGDSWRAGDRREIYWRYPEALQGRLMSEELGLYRNEQYVSGLFVRQRIAERKGRFNWTIPAALPQGEYRVRLRAGDLAGTGEYTATSDLFRITSEVSCGLNCAFDGNCMPGCGAGGCPADPDCQCLTNADCPSGFVCAGGRCQQTDRCNNCNSNGVCNYGCEANGCGRDPDCAGSDCVDTDGGLNALVLGEARDTRGGYFRDVCLSDSAVKEAYCTGSSSFGNVDVVLATDISGSMDATFPGQIPGCPSGNKREIAKCVEKQFVDAVLAANPLNRVGLVAFAGTVLSTNAPSRDAQAIKNVISGYATCISCGIRGAESLLDTHSTDPSAAKVIVIMTDGRANICDGNDGNNRCIGPNPAAEMVEFACAAKAKGYRIWAVGYGLDSVAAANLQQAACCDDCSHFANGADAAALSRIYNEYAQQISSLASITGAAAAGTSSSGSVAATQALSCPQGTMCRGGACVQSACPAQCVADPARACDPRCGQGSCPQDPDCVQTCPYTCRADNFCDTRCAFNTYCASDPDCAGPICPLNCAADQRCVAQCAMMADCQADPDCGCRSNADCPHETSRWCEGARACTGISQGECTQPGTPSASCVVSPYTAITCTNCPNGCSNGVCRSTTAPCTDSDSGLNYTVPGTVLFNGSEYRDRCLNDLYIEENYCHNNARWSLTQPCDGRCQDGACRTSQPAGCPIDTDGGLNYTVAGRINYQGTIWADTCKSGRVLNEVTCTQVTAAWLYDIRVVDYTCPNGCANGACMAVPPQCLDADRDGYNRPVAGMHPLCLEKIDCNDNNARINPAAQEVCGNAVDEDCTGADTPCPQACVDNDADGYFQPQAGIPPYCRDRPDCNDRNAAVHPGAQEVCGNGVDEDCSGADLPCSAACTDSDGGRTYFVRGSVSIPGAGPAVFDSCPYENSSGGTGSPLYAKPPPQTQAVNPLLKERYCEGGQIRTEEYLCRPGPCREGACRENDSIVCTQDVKLCPDGSYVGRIPPHCNFAPCPVCPLTCQLDGRCEGPCNSFIGCRPDPDCPAQTCPAVCLGGDRTCDSRCGRGACPTDPDCGQTCPLVCGLDQRCVAQCVTAAGCSRDPDCLLRCTTTQECLTALGANWNCNIAGQCVLSASIGNCPLSCGSGDTCNNACANTAGCTADPDCPLPGRTSSPLFSKIMFVGGAVKALAGEIDDELAAVPELLPPEIPAPGPLEQEFTLTVGDRRSVFGATLMLMDIQGSRATLAVLAGTQDGGGTPVCGFVGTKDEGWYIGERLIKKEECGCRAICKKIGKSKEGWYSSCTKKLILQTKCSDQARLTSTMGGTPFSLVQNADTGLLELQSAETASTAETLLVEDGRVAMRTAAGDLEVNILPEDARALAEEYGLTGVTSITLENRGGRPVYRVAGRMERRFLGIFLRSQAADVFVDAQTGEVV